MLARCAFDEFDLGLPALIPDVTTMSSRGVSVADLDIRIMTFDGKLLGQLTLDPTQSYQPSGLPAMGFVRVRTSREGRRQHTWCRRARWRLKLDA
jgi:hypothetical protein